MTIIGKRIRAKELGTSDEPIITGIVEGFGTGTGHAPSHILLVRTDVGRLLSISTSENIVTAVEEPPVAAPEPTADGVSKADLLEFFAARESCLTDSVRTSFADASYAHQVRIDSDDGLIESYARFTRRRTAWRRLGEAAGLIDEHGAVEDEAIARLTAKP